MFFLYYNIADRERSDNMLKVVIVEDDVKTQNKVKKVVRNVTFNLDDDVEIQIFSGYSDDLKKVIVNNDFRKIYIMDIQLENSESGIFIAKKIRDFDWDSQIIFITDHDKMFETVFRNVYNVFDFIEKFHDFESRLESSLRKIFSMNFDNKLFYYSSRNIDLQIFMKNILYVYRETVERKIIVVTDNNKFLINMSLQEIIDKLDDRFVMVHRACIVNKEHVQEFNWNKKYFLLDNGEIVNMLSKKYRKGFLL